MNKIIIAIDGHAGCGKSTTAKLLAKKLNYVFIDSGAMYRAVTLYMLEQNIDINDTLAMLKALEHIDIAFEFDSNTGNNEILLNKRLVSHEIRSMRVNENVSAVSSIKEIRHFLVTKQKEIGSNKGIVMDGRDIGTVVFPEAELKIFMTASIEARASRRLAELESQGVKVSQDDIIKNLRERDQKDSTRRESPLRKADDAIIVDTSNLTIDDQVDKVHTLALSKIKTIE